MLRRCDGRNKLAVNSRFTTIRSFRPIHEEKGAPTDVGVYVCGQISASPHPFASRCVTKDSRREKSVGDGGGRGWILSIID